MQGLSVIKETKFECIWSKLERKKYVQRQPFTKYLRLTLEIVHYGKSLISVVQESFNSIDKIFILAGILDTKLSFYEH